MLVGKAVRRQCGISQMLFVRELWHILYLSFIGPDDLKLASLVAHGVYGLQRATIDDVADEGKLASDGEGTCVLTCRCSHL